MIIHMMTKKEYKRYQDIKATLAQAKLTQRFIKNGKIVPCDNALSKTIKSLEKILDEYD